MEREELLKKSPTLTSLKLRQCVVTIACFVSQAIIIGINSALGVVYVELIREFDALRSEAALVQSIYLGILLLGGVFLTRLIQKLGPGICNATGSVVLCISFFIAAMSVNIYMVIVFAGTLAGIGASMIFLSGFATIHLAFKTKKKAAMAVLTISSTLGQFIFPFVIENLLETYYWNGSFLILSGLALQLTPLGMMVHFSERSLHDLKAEKAVDENRKNNVRYVEILREPIVICVIVIMLSVDIGIFTQLLFIVDLAEMRHFDRSVGAMFSSMIGFASFAGRVTGLILLCVFVNINASVYYVYGLILYGIGHFVIGYFKDYWIMLIGVLLEGFSSGLLIANFPAVMMEQCGMNRFIEVHVVSGVVDTAGGFIGGKIADQTGGYELMYYIAAVCDEFGSLLMLILLLYKHGIKRVRYIEMTKDSQNEKNYSNL